MSNICNCGNIETMNLAKFIAKGHHEDCENCPSDEAFLRELMLKMISGIEEDGCAGDGIPEYLWEPYRTAKAFFGKFVQQQEAT